MITTTKEQELDKKRPNNRKTFSFYTVLIAFLLAIGFVGGKIYEQQNLNTVYILDEHKFFKLVAVGFATDLRDQSKKQSSQEDLVVADREKLKVAMQKFAQILKEEYTKYPILVLKKNKAGEIEGSQNRNMYDIYSNPRKIDITNDVIIKIIGEEKWKEIGKLFLKP